MVRIPKIYEYATQHAEAGSEYKVRNYRFIISMVTYLLSFNCNSFTNSLIN